MDDPGMCNTEAPKVVVMMYRCSRLKEVLHIDNNVREINKLPS